MSVWETQGHLHCWGCVFPVSWLVCIKEINIAWQIVSIPLCKKATEGESMLLFDDIRCRTHRRSRAHKQSWDGRRATASARLLIGRRDPGFRPCQITLHTVDQCSPNFLMKEKLKKNNNFWPGSGGTPPSLLFAPLGRSWLLFDCWPLLMVFKYHKAM